MDGVFCPVPGQGLQVPPETVPLPARDLDR